MHAFISTTSISGVNKDKKDSYIGVGVFQLIRRDFLEQTLGWPWLKLEIGDDMGMALLCHQQGAKSRVIMAHEFLSVRWYDTLKSMMQGLEKNLFPVAARFSLLRAGLITVMIVLIVCAPYLLMSLNFIYSGASILIVTTVLSTSLPLKDSTLFERLLAPYLLLLLCLILVKSMWKTLRQRGVIWRGTFYPMEELKQGQRLKW